MRMTRSRASQPRFSERTLLFSDIESSTERWDADPECMRVLLEHHDRAVAQAIEGSGGVLVKTTGDGAIGAFATTGDAIAAALELPRRVAAGPVETGQRAATPLRVRLGLHRGVVEARDGDLFGPPMHRCARIMAAAHGGQILVSAAVAAELNDRSSLDLQVIDRGTHRLKGFHQHERISEIVPGGETPRSGGLRTENAVKGWLPAIDGDAFIGREDELAAVSELLEPGRIVTMVGTGGVGKTRLAVHVADQSRDAFPDGVWFVDLAALADTSRVVPAIADALAVVESSDHSLIEAIGLALRERRVLLLLDNCEHVVDGVRAALVAAMGTTATATVLCTSQRDVGVRGEHVVPIGPLEAAGDARESPAGRLFLERARSADADFVADDQGLLHIRAICERLEGLPLAIELAAARVRVMSVAEIAERLTVTLELLRTRDEVGRHRTLDATIAWSLDLLPDADRQALCAMSVFVSAFARRGAVAVAGGDELGVLDSMEELARRSLLVRLGDRFRLLEPIRIHCQATLAQAGDLGAAQERHAQWMRSWLPAPLDDPDAVVVATRLDAVAEASEDLDAAFRFLARTSPEDAARLALGLCDYWMTRSRQHVALDLLSTIEVEKLPPALGADLLGEIAYLGWASGRLEEGELAGRRAMATAADAGLELPTWAATWVAVRLAFSNRATEARALAEAVEAAVRGGNGDLTRCFGPLSIVFGVTRDLPHALEVVDESIAAARERGVVALTSNIGNRLLLAPEDPSSEPLQAEAVELSRTIGRTELIAHGVLAAGNRCLHHGDVAGFLSGTAEFCDLMLDSQPPSVLSALQVAIEPASLVSPRVSAVLMGAVEQLADALQHQGSPLDTRRRGRVTERTIEVIGADEFARACAEGSGLSLDEAVDLLRWLCELAAESSPA